MHVYVWWYKCVIFWFLVFNCALAFTYSKYRETKILFSSYLFIIVLSLLVHARLFKWTLCICHRGHRCCYLRVYYRWKFAVLNGRFHQSYAYSKPNGMAMFAQNDSIQSDRFRQNSASLALFVHRSAYVSYIPGSLLCQRLHGNCAIYGPGKRGNNENSIKKCKILIEFNWDTHLILLLFLYRWQSSWSFQEKAFWKSVWIGVDTSFSQMVWIDFFKISTINDWIQCIRIVFIKKWLLLQIDGMMCRWLSVFDNM